MRYPGSFLAAGFLATLAALALPLNARAQIDPTILWEPWAEQPHWADTVDELLFFNTGSTKGAGGQRTDSWYWNSYGRIKPAKENSEPPFVIGYRILSSSVTSDLAAINGDFWDLSVVVGGPVTTLANDWQLSLLGGAGTANDGHFSDTDAIYGTATVDFTRRIDEASQWHVGVFYNGNAVLLPDLPLPYVAYSRAVNDQVSYTLGLPQSTVLYRPWEPLELALVYDYPINLEASASYALTDAVRLFVQYNRDTDAFAIDNRDNRRLFYELNRVNGGVRVITRWIDVSVGVGWTFDQEYDTGFDLRQTRNVASITDELFFSVKLQGTF